MEMGFKAGQLALMPVDTLPRGRKPHCTLVAQEGALDTGGGSAGVDRGKENCLLLIAPQTFVQISAVTTGLFCTDYSTLPGMWLSSSHRHWPKGRASQSQAILSFARVHPWNPPDHSAGSHLCSWLTSLLLSQKHNPPPLLLPYSSNHVLTLLC